ncbi:CapA family protein [Kytococcus sp. HMSC28H12]|uniref:CapA family protein n=1 Tax=Kytococcus sp. HMSC28H12 TaxID=1581067 RepID=UPI0008A290A7|nr:CapA family protein [Kytococcus sp. HMSC28H12]OFS15699.1 hypothetical protein HMPREF3099_01435 [Kytococcus sp. HMSC28H12]
MHRPTTLPTRLLAGLVLGGLVLTGCGSDEPGTPEGDPSTTGSAPSSGSTSPEEAAGPDASPSSGASPSEGESAPSTPSSPQASASPSPDGGDAPRAFTVVTTGDMLTHFVLQERADALRPGDGYAFDGMLARVKPLVQSADLAACVQETPLSPDNEDLTDSPGTFSFNAPHELAEAMADAGYDACDTATNHTFDRGVQGIRDTRQVLRDNGIQPVGPVPPGDGGPRQPVLLDAGGATVALLSYGYNTLNAYGTTHNREMPWMDPHLYRGRGAEGITADARAAREAGADVVMVQMHWGTEYQQQPNAEQRELARAVLHGGAVDAIAGSHAHVVQPCETVDGRTVAYGMGNFLSEQGPNRYPAKPITTQDGVLLRWTFTPTTRDGETTWEQELEYQPTFVTRPDFVVQPTSPQENPASFERTRQAMNALGPGTCAATPLK